MTSYGLPKVKSFQYIQSTPSLALNGAFIPTRGPTLPSFDDEDLQTFQTPPPLLHCACCSRPFRNGTCPVCGRPEILERARHFLINRDYMPATKDELRRENGNLKFLIDSLNTPLPTRLTHHTRVTVNSKKTPIQFQDVVALRKSLSQAQQELSRLQSAAALATDAEYFTRLTKASRDLDLEISRKLAESKELQRDLKRRESKHFTPVPDESGLVAEIDFLTCKNSELVQKIAAANDKLVALCEQEKILKGSASEKIMKLRSKLARLQSLRDAQVFQAAAVAREDQTKLASLQRQVHLLKNRLKPSVPTPSGDLPTQGAPNLRGPSRIPRLNKPVVPVDQNTVVPAEPVRPALPALPTEITSPASSLRSPTSSPEPSPAIKASVREFIKALTPDDEVASYASDFDDEPSIAASPVADHVLPALQNVEEEDRPMLPLFEAPSRKQGGQISVVNLASVLPVVPVLPMVSGGGTFLDLTEVVKGEKKTEGIDLFSLDEEVIN